MPDRRRVLLVGWDAADWKVLSPLLDAGHLPALASLVGRGAMGNLATLDPPFSPMLWTSIATGHTADRHGVLHFVEPRPDGGGARPVLGTTRKTKAIWDIAGQAGLRSNVVGWWPSHPAEPIAGAMVSELFQKATGPVWAPWPLAEGVVTPPELAGTLASLRVHPAEITGAHLTPMIPDLAAIDTDADRRPARLAKILADAASVQAAATFLMETTDWDFTAVYFDAIDHASHLFMKYRPPRHGTATDEDVARYGGVVEGVVRFHDMMLGRMLELVDEDTTVLVVSDHGFHSDHLRPTAIPDVPAGPALEHRPFGVVVMAGPETVRDARVYGAGLLNVAPTVLAALGLPLGEDMRAPIIDAFAQPPATGTVPSWEDEGPPRRAADADADPWAEHDVLRHLADLGYVDPEPDPVGGAAAAARDSAFNLGRVFLSTGRAAEAVGPFERAYAEPSRHRTHYGLWLAHAYAQAGRPADAEALAAELAAADDRAAPHLDLLRADLAVADGRADDALARLAEADDRDAEVQLRRGQAYLVLGRPADADAAFDAVLAADPDNARAHHGRAKAALLDRRYGDAADAALAAVARLYHYPEAHVNLGVAMARLGWVERAEQAFRVALTQAPGLRLAHRWLARIYGGPLADPEAAARHRAAAGAEEADPFAEPS